MSKNIKICKYNVLLTNINGERAYVFRVNNSKNYEKVYLTDNYDTNDIENIRLLVEDLKAHGIQFLDTINNDVTLKILGLYLAVSFKLHRFNKNKYYKVDTIAHCIKNEFNLFSYYNTPLAICHRNILKEIVVKPKNNNKTLLI